MQDHSSDSELQIVSDQQQPEQTNGATHVPTSTRGEATRRRILDAAEEVFGERGYYEASVSEITRRARVAQGTFYIYFPGKRNIFAELVEDIGTRLRAEIREAMADIPDRLEAERYGFEAFFSFVARHNRIYRIVQEAERVAPEAARSYYLRISQGYIRGLSSAIEEGTIRQQSPEAIAYALMGIGHFVALRWLVWPLDRLLDDAQQDNVQQEAPQLPDEIFQSVMDFIRHGLAPS